MNWAVAESPPTSGEASPDSLAYWISQNQNEEVRRLIKHGVDVNAADTSGDCPLIVAVNHSNWEAMRLLLEAGAKTNIRNSQGRTPLHLTVSKKSFDDTLDARTLAAAKVLIAQGANVSDATSYGETALYIATYKRFNKMVELLVESGANVNEEYFDNPGGYGLTPTLLAEDMGYPELAAYLRSKGGDINHGFVAKRAWKRATGRILQVIIAPFYYRY